MSEQGVEVEKPRQNKHGRRSRDAWIAAGGSIVGALITATITYVSSTHGSVPDSVQARIIESLPDLIEHTEIYAGQVRRDFATGNCENINDYLSDYERLHNEHMEHLRTGSLASADITRTSKEWLIREAIIERCLPIRTMTLK